MRTAARENRAFLGRAVRYPAGQAGVRQFLDIGAGLAFGGLELVDPGVVLVSQWHPPAGPRPLPAEVNWYGGIGRKPAS